MTGMKKLTACLMLASVLAGCGQTIEAPPPDAPGPTAPADAAPTPTIPTDPSAGPSGADNMTWQFNPPNSPNVGSPLARLMYASYGSEGMALNLQCENDTVYARLWRGQQREVWPFSLRSGAARADLRGTTEGESEVIVTATLPVTAPVFTAFRGSGDLTLIDGDRTVVMDAINDQERQAIAGFFTACS
jgi:hypothetical protein